MNTDNKKEQKAPWTAKRVPIFLWILIWCVGRFQNKRNMASLDILSSNPEEREKMEKAVREEMAKRKADQES